MSRVRLQIPKGLTTQQEDGQHGARKANRQWRPGTRHQIPPEWRLSPGDREAASELRRVRGADCIQALQHHVCDELEIAKHTSQRGLVGTHHHLTTQNSHSLPGGNRQTRSRLCAATHVTCTRQLRRECPGIERECRYSKNHSGSVNGRRADGACSNPMMASA